MADLSELNEITRKYLVQSAVDAVFGIPAVMRDDWEIREPFTYSAGPVAWQEGSAE